MKNALIIFVRKPVLGKVKTRLAAQIGNERALEVYIKLLDHTKKISKEIDADKFLFGTETPQDACWEGFVQAQQIGDDLGIRMKNAFNFLFKKKYERVVIIGSDCISLNKEIIENALDGLKENDAVIGPAEDGGYYLLGIKKLHSEIFLNKNWSTDSVYPATLKSFDELNLQYKVLPILSDVDEAKDVPAEWLLSKDKCNG